MTSLASPLAAFSTSSSQATGTPSPDDTTSSSPKPIPPTPSSASPSPSASTRRAAPPSGSPSCTEVDDHTDPRAKNAEKNAGLKPDAVAAAHEEVGLAFGAGGFGGDVVSTHNPSTLTLGGPKFMTLSGVIFDKVGTIKILDGQFKRATFCAEHSLQPRDLSKVDSPRSQTHPAVLVRENALLINLLHIRALIKSDSLILISTVNGSDDSTEEIHHQSAFVHDLQGLLQSKSTLPFELRAVEAILTSVISVLTQELKTLQPEVEALLQKIDSGFDPEVLKNLLLVQRRTSKLDQKLAAIRATFSDLLHNDEDLAAMYLSAKASGKPHEVSDHIDAELILEHYLRLVDELGNSVSSILSNIAMTQSIMRIVLDARRNALIVTDLKANLATVALAWGSMVAGFFGMNVPSHMENVPGIFWILALGVSVGAMAFFVATVRIIQRGWHDRSWFNDIRKSI